MSTQHYNACGSNLLCLKAGNRLQFLGSSIVALILFAIYFNATNSNMSAPSVIVVPGPTDGTQQPGQDPAERKAVRINAERHSSSHLLTNSIFSGI